jgi:hypothetical protein
MIIHLELRANKSFNKQLAARLMYVKAAYQTIIFNVLSVMSSNLASKTVIYIKLAS